MDHITIAEKCRKLRLTIGINEASMARALGYPRDKGAERIMIIEAGQSQTHGQTQAAIAYLEAIVKARIALGQKNYGLAELILAKAIPVGK